MSHLEYFSQSQPDEELEQAITRLEIEAETYSRLVMREEITFQLGGSYADRINRLAQFLEESY
jgi:hypothetical protein